MDISGERIVKCSEWTYVKAISNSVSELTRERSGLYGKDFTIFEEIKKLLLLRTIDASELSMVAINLLATEGFFR